MLGQSLKHWFNIGQMCVVCWINMYYFSTLDLYLLSLWSTSGGGEHEGGGEDGAHLSRRLSLF